MVTVSELDERLVTKTVMDKTRTVPRAGDGAVRLPPGEHWHPRRTRDFKSVPEQADAGAKQGVSCIDIDSYDGSDAEDLPQNRRRACAYADDMQVAGTVP